jgi:hypothetical protein
LLSVWGNIWGLDTPLYFEFVNREDWGAKEAISISHDLLTLAISGKPFSDEILDDCISQLEDFTPDTEEFSDCTYATDAGIIHIYSIELLKQHKPENIYYVAQYCYEIVDASLFELIMPDGGIVTQDIERKVENHPLMQAELDWQSSIRDGLMQLREGDADVAETKISERIRKPLLQ